MTAPSTIARLLAADGVAAADAELVPLSGGVSCDVWHVEPRFVLCGFVEANPHGLVIKSPLARLRVPTTWEADVSRAGVEAAALRLFGDISPGLVPPVVWEHRTDPVIAISSAPRDWRDWREVLSEGDATDIVDICTTLGTTLARWHVATEDPAALPAILTTGDRLRTLRTDPFHRAAAVELPQVSDELFALAGELEAARTCLVHGDFSPKNVLVASSHPGALWIIDAEVAHFGNPSLDAAFMSAHLLLKAVWRPEMAVELAAGRVEFEAAYRSISSLVPARSWSAQTGAILAGRVWGVSRANYLSQADREQVTEIAISLVSGQSTLDGIWARI